MKIARLLPAAFLLAAASWAAPVDLIKNPTLETTAAVLDVAGTVTASGEVTVPVAQDQADGEWLVMTADSFDAEFVSTNPRFALYTRNGGTELWLTKKLGTLILVK